MKLPFLNNSSILVMACNSVDKMLKSLEILKNISWLE